jgi:hypothetical protein
MCTYRMIIRHKPPYFASYFFFKKKKKNTRDLNLAIALRISCDINTSSIIYHHLQKHNESGRTSESYIYIRLKIKPNSVRIKF